MDPTIAAFDLDKAGAIIASMVESYLAANASPTRDQPSAPPLEVPQACCQHELPRARFQRDAKGAAHDDGQDQRTTSDADGICLHPSIDAGAGALQSGEHGTPVQFGEQGGGPRLEAGPDPGARPRSRPIGCEGEQSGRLQVAGERRGDGQCGRNLLARSVAAGALEPGLASPARTVRDYQHSRDRRRRLLRSDRVQRRPRARHEGHVCSSRTAHHPIATPRRQDQQGEEGRTALPVAGRLRLGRRQDRARSRPGSAGRSAHRVRVVRGGRDRVRRRATLSRPRPAVSAPCVRRCLERQADLGPTHAFARARPAGQSELRRCLRVRSLSSAQAGHADRRDQHGIASGDAKRIGGSRFPIITPATSPGIASKPTANGSRPTRPTAR